MAMTQESPFGCWGRERVMLPDKHEHIHTKSLRMTLFKRMKYSNRFENDTNKNSLEYYPELDWLSWNQILYIPDAAVHTQPQQT